jgi:2-polyprenyl-3-methyl-5-hydroxy-6-metoxy-1,4-benzoquinol methylase
MDTVNTTLKAEKENRAYYSKSDGHYMPEQYITVPNFFLDRMAWLLDSVTGLKSKVHISCGCKDGYEVLMLKGVGIDAVGYEPSVDAVEVANKRAKQLGYGELFKVSFVEDLPDTLQSDTICALEVIEHVIDVDVFLKKLFTIGKYVLISTPEANGRHGLEDSKKNKEHVRIFTQKELEEAMSKYGEIVSSVVRDDQICIVAKSKLTK